MRQLALTGAALNTRLALRDLVLAAGMEVRHLTPDAMRALKAAVLDGLRPYATFARYTGARRGEIFGLTWNDVDLKPMSMRQAWEKQCRKARVGIPCACVGQTRDLMNRKKCRTSTSTTCGISAWTSATSRNS